MNLFDTMEELRNPSLNVDMVKLFVGQIPKDMDEESLRVYFEEFGPLSELSIIRDSANLTSKGMVKKLIDFLRLLLRSQLSQYVRL